jgi:hypothetical protein
MPYSLRIFARFMCIFLIFPLFSFWALQKYLMGESHITNWKFWFPAISFLLIHAMLFAISACFSFSFILTNGIFLGFHLANAGKRLVRGECILTI